MRADLHTLFDLDLIGIDPNTLRVSINPALMGKGYDDVEGRALSCGAERPDADALKERWVAFRARCGKAVTASA